MRRILQFQIPEDKAGGLLIDFLPRQFPYLSREGWLDRLAQGRVLINGAVPDVQCRLAHNDVL